MSAHNAKSRVKQSAERLASKQLFPIAHVTFEVDRQAGTFALIAGEAVHAKDRRPMFTGFLDGQTADQLRAMAQGIDQICMDLRKAEFQNE